MRKNVQTPDKLKFWTEVSRLVRGKVLPGKFVLKQKKTGHGAVFKYQAHLEVCANGESENKKKGFSPLPDFFIVKFLAVLANKAAGTQNTST